MHAKMLDSLLRQFPRTPLAALPTPLEPLPRLSVQLSRAPILIKRDDLTGLYLGGNKVRQLEFVFGHLLAQGCDCVVAGGVRQSNWCRQIAAAGAKLGVPVHLLLVGPSSQPVADGETAGKQGNERQGNELLIGLLGVDVVESRAGTMEALQNELDARAETLRRRGARPFVIGPRDPHSRCLGALGYVAGALELADQLNGQKQGTLHVYTAGFAVTPAGLGLGLTALGVPFHLHIVVPERPDRPGWSRAGDILGLADRVAELLQTPLRLSARNLTVSEAFAGAGYAELTPESRAAIHCLATSEGVLLDPTYTGRAMACLMHDCRTGRHTADDRIVFLHTGGLPVLFAYAGALAS